ncbi:hypothetical protein [Streptomyces nanshensis]|uniref:Uncharacterized protein n=1 Tax=Streptomyces nanshensis TaxID=518642 RepID=A0A1E7L7N1_9ACTN|nr:hypothetical protein [Streptomyces nanshensis]OEV12222.1 hypothetical protein AN218_09355 [Streptomyces nanshensis]
MQDLPALAAAATWAAVVAALVTAERIYLPSQPHLPPRHRLKDGRITIVAGVLSYLAALGSGLLPPPMSLPGRAADLLLWVGGITLAVRAGYRAEIRSWADYSLADDLSKILPAVTDLHEQAPVDNERLHLLLAAVKHLQRHRGRDALILVYQVFKRCEPEGQRHEEWLRVYERFVRLAAEYAPHLARYR